MSRGATHVFESGCTVPPLSRWEIIAGFPCMQRSTSWLDPSQSVVILLNPTTTVRAITRLSSILDGTPRSADVSVTVTTNPVGVNEYFTYGYRPIGRIRSQPPEAVEGFSCPLR